MWTSRSKIGIDIGSTNIKVVKTTQKGKQLFLTDSAVYPTPAAVISNGVIIDPKKLGAVVQEILKNFKAKGSSVFFAVSGKSVLIRHFNMPKIPPEELREAIRWEAENQLPITLDNAVFDFQYWEEHDKENLTVMVVAATQGTIDAYLQTFETAGIKPGAIDIEPLCLYRTLQTTAVRELAILDFGASALKLSIFCEGKLQFTRMINAGGDAFTRAVSQIEHIGFEEAEERKKQIGAASSIPSVFADTYQGMVLELRRSFDYYTTQNPNARIERIYITGGGSCMPWFAASLQDFFQLKVENLLNIELLSKIIHVDDKKFSQNRGLLDLSLGLALRSEKA